MTTTPDPSRIDLANRLCPTVPAADDRASASAVLDQVLARTGSFVDDLRAAGCQHLDAAPSSSQHVLELTAAVSRAGSGLD